ncbi:MAG: hypothetical protein H7Y17_08335 [Chlorobia bacterium]|nr:hypothetical protein [Fimbriimonadaceae bacterium]
MKFLLTSVLAAVAAFSMAQGPCCQEKKPNQEDGFLKMAREMEMSAEGKKACCKTTATKSVEKGDKGCCNAKGEAAKFKVFVEGAGYKFFGCEDSAAKGRKELLAKGARAGMVQKVSTKTSL